MPNPKITCKLTGAVGPGVEAHIIPRALYQLGGEMGTIVYIDGDNYREGRMPMGEYDTTIVTIEGEKYFSDCDAYAARFFLNSRGENDGKVGHLICGDDGAPLAWTLGPEVADKDLIRRFCMSILWRASVSNRPFFDGVNVGVHEPRLRDLILKGEVGDPSDFSIILGRWIDTPEHGRPIQKPHIDGAEDVSGYRFYLPHFSFFIKVDDRPLPEDLLSCAAGGDELLLIFMMGRFVDSLSGRTVIAALKKNALRKARKQGLTLEKYLDEIQNLRNDRHQ